MRQYRHLSREKLINKARREGAESLRGRLIQTLDAFPEAYISARAAAEIIGKYKLE